VVSRMGMQHTCTRVTSARVDKPRSDADAHVCIDDSHQWAQLDCHCRMTAAFFSLVSRQLTSASGWNG